MAGHGAKSGERRGGRKKGTPNKLTKAVKESILEALNDGDGATAFFLSLKNSEVVSERHTFANICARLIPHEVKSLNETPLNPIEKISNIELARRIAFALSSTIKESENKTTY